MLPDNAHVTTEMVATYYEVDVSVIQQLVQRHRGELEGNGYRVPTGSEFTDIVSVKLGAGRPPALFTRRPRGRRTLRRAPSS